MSKPWVFRPGRCAKCGSKDIGVAWHNGGYTRSGPHCGFDQVGSTNGEHLHMTCHRCQWAWSVTPTEARRGAKQAKPPTDTTVDPDAPLGGSVALVEGPGT